MANEVVMKCKENIIIHQDMTFERFVGQFQTCTSKILCIVDNTIIHYYDRKRKGENMTEYYFRHIHDNTLYCIFGRESAKKFYHNIDNIDPMYPNDNKFEYLLEKYNKKQDIPNNQIIKQITYKKEEDGKEIIIVDKGETNKFQSFNFPIEIKTNK
jgi:hypothetical protein